MKKTLFLSAILGAAFAAPAMAAVTAWDISEWTGYDEASKSVTVGKLSGSGESAQYNIIDLNTTEQAWNTNWSFVVTIKGSTLNEALTLIGIKSGTNIVEGQTMVSGTQTRLATWSGFWTTNLNLQSRESVTLVFSRSGDASGNISCSIYDSSSDFTTALYTKDSTGVNAQNFSSWKLNGITLGGRGTNGAPNGINIATDNNVGSYTLTKAGYSLSSTASRRDLMEYTYTDQQSLTWSGTTDNHTWDRTSTIWSGVRDSFELLDSVTFGTDAASKTVSVTDNVVAKGMTVQDNYTFNIATGKKVENWGALSLAAGKTLSVTGTGALETDSFTMNGNATLDLATGSNMSIDSTLLVNANRRFQTQGNGTLTVKTLQNNNGDIFLGANTHITGGGDGQGDGNNKLGLAMLGGGVQIRIDAGTTTVDGATYLGGDATGAIRVGKNEVDAKLITTRLEMGDKRGGTSTLDIGAHGTVVVTATYDVAGNSNNAYKKTGLLLSEWENTTTASISGNLFAKDVQLRSGDSKMVLNINGGTLAVKGISQNTGQATANEITLTNDGKLILGSEGISSANVSNWVITLTKGEVGMTDDTTIGKAMTLSGAVTVNTSKYTWDTNKELVTTNDGTNAGAMTVSGVLSGSGSLNVKGGGSLTLSGTNTYSGGTTLSGASVTASNATALGTGNVNINGTSAITADDDVTLTLGGRLIMDNGSKVAISGDTIISDLVDASDSGQKVSTIAIAAGTTKANHHLWLANGSSVTLAKGASLAEGLTGFSYTGNKTDGNGEISVADGVTQIELVRNDKGSSWGNNANKKNTVLNDIDLTYAGTDAATFEGSITNGSVTTLAGAGTLTLAHAGQTITGLTANSNVTITADTTVSGTTTVAEAATLMVNGASLTLANKNTDIGNLTLGSGATLTLGSEESHDFDLTTTTLTVGGQSTLNANLVVLGGGTMDFSAVIGTGATLTMGCSVEIGNDVTVVIDESVVNSIIAGNTFDIIDSVDSITSLGSWHFQNAAGDSLDWANLRLEEVDNGDNTSRIVVAPEPATATLSLLALAALAARRKRH